MSIRIRDVVKAVATVLERTLVFAILGVIGVGVAAVPIWLLGDGLRYLSTGVWHTMNGLDASYLIGGTFGAWMESPKSMVGMRNILCLVPVPIFCPVAGVIVGIYLGIPMSVFTIVRSSIEHLDEQAANQGKP
jgi:hypothetical protein